MDSLAIAHAYLIHVECFTALFWRGLALWYLPNTALESHDCGVHLRFC